MEQTRPALKGVTFQKKKRAVAGRARAGQVHTALPNFSPVGQLGQLPRPSTGAGTPWFWDILASQCVFRGSLLLFHTSLILVWMGWGEVALTKAGWWGVGFGFLLSGSDSS